MSCAFTLRAEVARRIREVNAAFEQLDTEAQGKVAIVSDEALNAALLGEDEAVALAEVEAWRDRQLEAIEAVAR